MNNDDYVSMCLGFLKNKEWYNPISALSINQYNSSFYNMVDRAFYTGAITKNTYEFIRISHPRVATFYSLPKIHKNSTKLTGRPIVSGNGAISENLSRVIDAHLQPLVLSLPSFVRDTIQFLHLINDLRIPDNAILVTIDVEALYSSIPHSLGLAAVQKALQQQSQYDPALIGFILKGLHITPQPFLL